MLCLLGGVIGALVGSGGATAMSAFFQWNTIISPLAIVAGVRVLGRRRRGVRRLAGAARGESGSDRGAEVRVTLVSEVVRWLNGLGMQLLPEAVSHSPIHPFPAFIISSSPVSIPSCFGERVFIRRFANVNPSITKG